MKGFLVVDRLNDIHFIDTDKEFARHINTQAKEKGLIPEDQQDVHTVDPNIVMQHFSPLFMSQWFLIDQAHTPCSSITCENDFIMVFKHFDEYLLVAINGDGTESEDFLTRKTLVFARLMGFLMGPVHEEIGRPRFERKADRWHFLRILMSTWTYLARNEQSFLVEAVEKLHMNQVVSEQCVEILQACINRMSEVGESRTQHALLLVNSKLLSLYSNRNASELQSADILCIIVLVRSLFPTHEKLEDLFAQSYRLAGGQGLREEAKSPASVKVRTFRHERYESAVEGFTTGDETDNEQYYTALEGKLKGDSSPSLDWSMLGDSDSGGTQTPYPEVSESFVTPTTSPVVLRKEDGTFPVFPGEAAARLEAIESNVALTNPGPSAVGHLGNSKPRSHTAGEVEGHKGLRGSRSEEEPMGRGRSSSFGENKRKGGNFCSEKSSSDTRLAQKTVEPDDQEYQEYPMSLVDQDCVKKPVFLATGMSKFSPHQIHCRRIYPGIILIVLTESNKMSQAPRLVDVLQLLKDLMSGSRDQVSRRQGQELYEAINNQLTRMFSALKKARGPIEGLCAEIKRKWESEEIRSGMVAYLEQSSRTDMTASLERSLKALRRKLTELFLYLYLSPRPLTSPISDALTWSAELFRQQLGDYKDYLVVKGQRNITMTSYIEDFPGLIHFIYVNRRTNQMMAPALNITQTDEKSSPDATQLLKEKIWKMANWMQCKLHEGYTSVFAREGDYHFSYFLWFENLSGDPEVIQHSYRADFMAPPPGILTGNFYKYITHKCFPNGIPSLVHCNELYMMHVGLANTQYISGHCRQLAARLYETSGDVLTTSSLFST
ncbi:BLOC-3 complex member HPS1-like [Mya arenaria]|uniref:BLOC-3 complex member HPS1-like n=1 Tax=Mya arenaria TaxID=6604 RepID=UPI0022DF9F1A|nr:BLOC-3 complex member HPS1-like [Mya arenaria]